MLAWYAHRPREIWRRKSDLVDKQAVAAALGQRRLPALQIGQLAAQQLNYGQQRLGVIGAPLAAKEHSLSARCEQGQGVLCAGSRRADSAYQR